MPLSVAAGRDSYRSTACRRNSSEKFVLAVRTDSRLQTGQNPILVNANCTSGAQVGQTFNDLQCLSHVLIAKPFKHNNAMVLNTASSQASGPHTPSDAEPSTASIVATWCSRQPEIAQLPRRPG